MHASLLLRLSSSFPPPAFSHFANLFSRHFATLVGSSRQIVIVGVDGGRWTVDARWTVTVTVNVVEVEVESGRWKVEGGAGGPSYPMPMRLK